MEIKLTIPDENKDEAINALCSAYDYDERKEDKETKAQFAKRKIVDFVKEVVRSARINAAIDATRATETSKPDILIT